MQPEQAGAVYQGNLLVFQQYNQQQQQQSSQENYSITKHNYSTNNNIHLSPNYLSASYNQIPYQPQIERVLIQQTLQKLNNRKTNFFQNYQQSLCESSGKMSIENEPVNNGQLNSSIRKTLQSISFISLRINQNIFIFSRLFFYQKFPLKIKGKLTNFTLSNSINPLRLDYSPMESSLQNTFGQSEDCISLEKSYEKSPIFQKLAFIFTLDVKDDKQNNNQTLYNQVQHQKNDEQEFVLNMQQSELMQIQNRQQQQNLTNLHENASLSGQSIQNIDILNQQVKNSPISESNKIEFFGQQPEYINQNQILLNEQIPVNTYRSKQQINSNQSQIEENNYDHQFQKVSRKKIKNNNEQPYISSLHQQSEDTNTNSYQKVEPGQFYKEQQQQQLQQYQQRVSDENQITQQQQQLQQNQIYNNNHFNYVNNSISQLQQENSKQNELQILQNINQSNLFQNNNQIIISNKDESNQNLNISHQQDNSSPNSQFNYLQQQQNENNNNNVYFQSNYNFDNQFQDQSSIERANQNIFEKLKEKSNQINQQNFIFEQSHQESNFYFDQHLMEEKYNCQDDQRSFDDQTLPIQERNTYQREKNSKNEVEGFYSDNESVSSNANNTKSKISSQDDIDDLLNLEGINLDDCSNNVQSQVEKIN